jgi:hypothetical protein
MRRNHLAWIVACLLTTGTVGFANAQGTSIAFVSKADALTGTITHYDEEGVVIDQAQISPQDQSTTDTNGSDSENASTSSGTALGIQVYSITNAQNSTTGSNVTGNDGTQAKAGVRTISFLGGLVNIDVQTTTLTGVADSSNPDQVDITDAQADATTVNGTGISIAPGTYAGGSSFPVSGLVTVPGTDSKQTFTGQLVVAQVLQGTDPTTGASVLTFTAEQLVGTVNDGAGGYYKITLGGPLTPPSPGTGTVVYKFLSAAKLVVSG